MKMVGYRKEEVWIDDENCRYFVRKTDKQMCSYILEMVNGEMVKGLM